MKKKIVLVGGGGHAKVVIDAIRCKGEYDIYGIVDPKLKAGDKILGVRIIGTDDELPDLFYKKKIKYAFIGIGSLGDERTIGVRKKVAENLEKLKFKMPVIMHPKAIVAKDVKIGEGTFIAAGSIINPGTKIGKNVIVNTGASVDHDCEIGNFAHIAPGVTLSGNVKVGDETHMGTGASIIQNITIGKNCFIKAGAIIKNNLQDNTTMGSEMGWPKGVHEKE